MEEVRFQILLSWIITEELLTAGFCSLRKISLVWKVKKYFAVEKKKCLYALQSFSADKSCAQ